MVELDVTNSNPTINGVYFDFRGYAAELSFSGEIKKVVCLATGKDVTEEFKIKYGQK
ncbi:hypothetical protein [Acinetobacter baumannii]|uniref:hypothetical protein n=1 Tax=Acinetobacter baumannii TaxID=470 RepID=UPI001DAA4123|nr:hypothetical protein [Acinetobacter baumannii]EHU2279232.1 hypothetical protein [Acinetobacter baumannii]MDC4146528.1 hypothetical protein [Acinetobacter baumannii]